MTKSKQKSSRRSKDQRETIMATQQERLRRVVVGFKHRGDGQQQTGRDPDDPHSLSQLQVAALLAVGHNVAVVSSHGLRNKLCTCGVEDCERPGAHPGTPNGLEDATTDPAVITVFWTQWPKAKVIIATGKEDVLAVTVKGPKASLAFKAMIGEENKSSLETLQFFHRGVRTYLWRMAGDAMPNGEITLADGVIAHGRGSSVIVPRDLRKFTRHKPLYDSDIGPVPSSLLTALGLPASALPARPLEPEPEPEQDEPAEQDLDLSAYPPSYSYDESSPERLKLNLFPIDLDWIVVPDGSPACTENRVRALAETYGITGPRTPLAVRLLAGPTKDSDPVFNLLSDPARLEALKRLGITCADCFVIKGDERDERLYKLAELIHQPEVKWLDWALLVMEWIRESREKGAQPAHPRGGRQPHDKGFSAAHRVLGISRRDLGRAERFANICADAQAVIREAKLDDLLTALEEIANEPAGQQVEKALELKERYRRPRRNRATNGDANPDTAPQQDQVPEAESPDLAPDDRDSDEGTEEEKSVESPDTTPGEPSGDIDQPSALGRRAGDDEKFEIVTSLWDQYIADEWDDASEKMHLRFLKHLGYTVVAAKKSHKFHH
jgi:Bifunctional DNA primase/polymerase, N-terminal